MPQGYCTLQAAPECFALADGATATSSVQVASAGTLIWSDASPDLLTPGTTAILSAYGGATIDTTQNVYLLMAIKGGSPLLMLEADLITNVESVLSGATWAILRRIQGPEISPYPAV